MSCSFSMSKPMSRYVFSLITVLGGVRFLLAHARCQIWVRGLTGASPQFCPSHHFFPGRSSLHFFSSTPPRRSRPKMPRIARSARARSHEFFGAKLFVKNVFLNANFFTQNFAPRRFFYPQFFQSIFLFLHKGFSMDFLPIFKKFSPAALQVLKRFSKAQGGLQHRHAYPNFFQE